MSTLGLTMMVTTWIVVISITARFFMKVLKQPDGNANDQ